MLKSELIIKLAEKIPMLTERDVDKGVECILEKLAKAMELGDRVEVRDFGSFSLHYRGSREAHNPKTHKRVMTLPKYSPHFKPGKEMRDRIDASRERAS